MKKKIYNFLLNIQFLFKPNYWLMNYSYSKEWNKKLNDMMDKYYFSDTSIYAAYLGDKYIWVGNYPYASFTGSIYGYTYRPSRLTIKRARKHLLISEKLSAKKTTFNYFKLEDI